MNAQPPTFAPSHVQSQDYLNQQKRQISFDLRSQNTTDPHFDATLFNIQNTLNVLKQKGKSRKGVLVQPTYSSNDNNTITESVSFNYSNDKNEGSHLVSVPYNTN